ncbi:glutathione hydrolase-like YwrD proenzyme [Dunckerocampus dactyliophorus]|uniref:glutathione hydrolase-like YwrD proenzyme n=1 Tax=Dunckerocampus dactyliophorus TaxID=161453 RepID=UPI0024070C70|nr:glutathione hydrolase-like YwrD proenzyme [Dunckerocampus dactyliophorus]XP_054645727.1 glutathione hydrolase-like YwrD proenzyme [Dunckerocampus dactyliophorus]XP_054645728.1 glutathione hydrolase-like YwrD proenzyme [Dunckerocampus dactyliophorus]
MDSDLGFSSRRSPIVCLHGCVASSQQLASTVGLDVLKRGGNAADAAVAIAAALAVTEPGSTGLGGDAFCLFFNGNTGEIRGINGSGRTPKRLTLDFLKDRGYSAEAPPPETDALNVTVPGAPACWCDTVQLFGSHKLSFQEVLTGAVELAEVGFPVAEVTAHFWAQSVAELRDAGKELGGDLLIDGHPPKHGEVFRNPFLAQTLKEFGERGKKAIYQGRVAQAIVDIIAQHGGVMTLDDLSSHDSELVTPISTEYKGVCLWEPPPNSQGLAALLLLNILENFPLKAFGHNSPDYIHVLVEAVRLALTDVVHYVGDPDHVTIPVQTLLDKSCSHQRAQLISMDRAMEVVEPALPTGSDTVYFCVVDSEGNACSFVNSTYDCFGCGLVPKDCGFSLQNRGAFFSLHHNSVNCVAGAKRPFHTIIPALVTDCATDSQKPRLLASLGVMGGMMQSQGHIQVLLNLLEFGMNPQQALDSPRVFVQHDRKKNQWLVNLEEGIKPEVAEALRRRGHKVNWPVTGHKRSQFGRGQIITVGDWWNPSVNHKSHATKVLWAGSDPRSDGCALGY